MKFNYLLRESQFHGGKRLADKHFRCWWSLGLLLLFGAAVAVIFVTIQRYLMNPTFMVQEETVENTREFPSVIVCPEVLFHTLKVDQFLNGMKIPPNLNRSYVNRTIYQLAAFFSPDVQYKTRDLMNLEEFLEYNGMDVDTAGRLLTANCEETLIRCRWHGEMVNCSELFSMELTGDGYCCVFHGRSWKRRNENHENEKFYKTRFAGFSSGLMLAVNQSQKPYDVDLSYKWLALQSRHHFVESSINGTPLNPGSEQLAAMHIQNFQIAEDARSLRDDLRGCHLRSERLEYFPVYHKKYCVVECEMHRTLERCNCVRNVHPLPEGARFCRAEKLLCATHAKVTYDSDLCNCPSACDVATDYVSTFNFKLIPGSHALDSFYDGLDYSKVTIVRAYLAKRTERTNSRWSYFNSIDLFAQLGGVFNLFFGCSILTIVELMILGLQFLRESLPDSSQGSGHKEELPKNNMEKEGEKTHKKRVKFVKTIS